jgi:hypothetical protein
LDQASQAKEIMLFILAFLLLMLGLAMVVLGPIPVAKTWTVPARVSRVAGTIFLALFPVLFLVAYLLKWLGWEESVNTALINWSLFALCLLSGGGWILLAGRPPKPQRQRGRATQDPQAAPDLPVAPIVDSNTSFPSPPSPAKRSAPREQNPFDFS